jgi:hypothetical protein
MRYMNALRSFLVASVMFTCCISFAQAATFIRPLVIGSQGSDVSVLQTMLKEKGFFTYPQITGYYGAFTYKAVLNFQRSLGYEGVGSVGPLTRAALNSLAFSAISSAISTSTQVTLPVSSAPIYTLPPSVIPGSPIQAASGGGGAAAPDTTSPVLSSPIGAKTGEATATLTVTTTEGNGTLYWVIATSTTAPSAAQVKAGQNQFGSTAFAGSSQGVSSAGVQTISVTGLAPGTTYYAHLMHEDASGNKSNVVSSGSFVTDVTLDLNFVNNTAFGNGASAVLTDLLTISRTTTAWAETSAGVWQNFAINAARITDRGILLEQSKTNVVQQNRDLTISHQLTVTGGSGTFTDGETVTATGGGSGTYVAGNSTATIFAVRNGSGTFSGTLTGGTSGATKTISSSATKWVKTNVTTSQNQTGVDGVANSATSVTTSADNGTIIQSVTDGSRARFVTAFLKRLTGSGAIQMTMDNGSTWTTVTVTSSWTRVSIPTQTLANPQVGFRLATNGDAVAVDFVQSENSGTFFSSPILTTTASVTRGADTVTLTNPNLTTLSVGTWLADVGPTFGYAGGIAQEVVNMRVDASNKVGIEIYTDNKLQAFSFSVGAFEAQLQSTNTVSADTTYKVAFAYHQDDFAMAFSSNLASSLVTDASGVIPAGSLSAVSIGNNNGGQQFNGYIRRLIWSPQRIENTALVNWAEGQ